MFNTRELCWCGMMMPHRSSFITCVTNPRHSAVQCTYHYYHQQVNNKIIDDFTLTVAGK